MRVAIIGSRAYPELDAVEAFVRKLAWKYPHATVISGGARGVDHQAEETAREMRLHVRSYRPKRRARSFEIILVETGRFVVTYRDAEFEAPRFKSYGQAAYFRDGLIVAEADQVVAFQYQGSTGTQHGIDIARKRGIPVHVYHPED